MTTPSVEEMLNGNYCEQCHEYLGAGDGMPRTCTGCGGDTEPWEYEDESVVPHNSKDSDDDDLDDGLEHYPNLYD